jgi:hypothetical protein
MATEIFNDGACIRILSNNNTLLISKLQIKTIDTVRTDTVRIDIGEGALKNIYIRFADVETPKGLINADDLRDYINNFLTTGVSGGATETKQDEQIRLLAQIAGLLTDIKTMVGRYTSGGGGKGSPQRIDESNPSEIYNGYATAGALTGDPVWAIERVSRRGDVISYTWADGNENFDNVWDDRLTLNYLPI